ncbi:uncharacterized protein DUF4172 [Bibersteinia trehalosi]|uniref:DUF4172 domain-containing protein n=1 Tax=Bibersteinia trehalosi TaxID=47735 RepID=UPI001043E9A9|nr:DUF4172 domain-containing protein [Bibersteinia trehalosi]TCT16466.1 uncharacterized protein DUF4172 [Bibersteinia trehalosi]
MTQFNHEYIWQKTNWHKWEYDLTRLSSLLNQTHYQQGLLLGKMSTLGFELSEQARLQVLTQSVLRRF